MLYPQIAENLVSDLLAINASIKVLNPRLCIRKIKRRA